jgi:peptidoglycan/LPS O-acetylase OafA/YrhL
MTDAGSSEHFRPDIEGLRAVAILVVVAFHAGIPGFHGGFIGVDVFFVLSGYLITSLLTRELTQTGRIDMPRFYARRVRRLLPGACLALAATVLIGRYLFSPLEQTGFARAAVATSLYVSNLWFATTATDYLGDSADTNPLLHTWSLAVEEQFYIVWPAILMFAYLRGRRPMWSLTLAVWLVTVVSLCVSIWLTHVAQPWAFFGSPARAWEFGAGALAFAALQNRRPIPPIARDVASWAALLALLWAVFAYDRQTPFPGVAALVPAIATAILLAAGAQAPGTSVGRVLAVRPMRWFGTMSYSWYLWHWPVLVLARSYYGPLSLVERAFWAVASLAIAVVAFRLVEDPVRHSRYLAERARRSIRLAVALTASCALLGLWWSSTAGHDAATPAQHPMAVAHQDIPVIYGDGCHLDFFQTRSPECVFGDGAATRALVLFGDSHAAQWFPALDVIAREGRFRLVSLTKSGCPAADVQVYTKALQRPYTECDEWRGDAVQRIVRLRPAAVFISNSNLYVAAIRRADPHAISSRDWIAGIDRLTSRLHSAGIRVVVIADSPSPGVDIPTCLSRAVWRGGSPGHDCSVPRVAAFRRDVIAAIEQATSSSVLSVNLNDAICPADTCPPQIDGQVVYRDGNHLTATFAASLAPMLLRKSRGAMDDL